MIQKLILTSSLILLTVAGACSCVASTQVASTPVEVVSPAQAALAEFEARHPLVEQVPGVFSPDGMFTDYFYENVVAPLVESVPLDYPVVLLAIEDLEDLGQCAWDDVGQRFLILVAVVPYGVTDTVCHEWAHAATWDVPHMGGSSHHAAWGAVHARCYRAAVEGL